MAAGPRILMTASEMTPFAQTGGLGDVLASLPAELQRRGASVHVVLPAYGTIDWEAAGAEPSGAVEVPIGSGRREAPLRTAQRGGVAVTFVEAHDYFDRDHLYGGPHGDYGDNAE